MKRDMDLIRLLLLHYEEEEPKPNLSTYSEEQQDYHCALLIEAGLADGVVIHDDDGGIARAFVLRLTWAGHEFLDAARNETVWKNAREKIKSSGVQVTMSLLQELLKVLLKQSIGLP